MSRSSTNAQSKQAERDVAETLGGRRLHAGEWHGGGDVDVVPEPRTNEWVAQVKHRRDVATYIQEGIKQLDEVRDPTPLRLLVIKTKPGRGKESEVFVLMRIEEWLRARPSN